MDLLSVTKMRCSGVPSEAASSDRVKFCRKSQSSITTYSAFRIKPIFFSQILCLEFRVKGNWVVLNGLLSNEIVATC